MKLAVVTRADNNIKDLTDLTHPIIKEFAKKWHADFLILPESSPCNEGDGRWHYRIMHIRELLNTYDRILHLDSDVVITPKCPNLFEITPPLYISSVFEDVGSRLAHRRALLYKVQAKFGDLGWRFGYINTGVFMVAQRHAEIFKDVRGEYWTGFGYDDVHLGWRIHYRQFYVNPLSYLFNHMSMFSEAWNGSPSRFDSFIIHYAGEANFPDKKNRSRLQLIADDIEKLY